MTATGKVLFDKIRKIANRETEEDFEIFFGVYSFHIQKESLLQDTGFLPTMKLKCNLEFISGEKIGHENLERVESDFRILYGLILGNCISPIINSLCPDLFSDMIDSCQKNEVSEEDVEKYIL